jgi:hypothetical protein
VIAGTSIALVLAGLALLFVASPLWRTRVAARRPPDETLSASRELQSRQEMLLSSLRDLEDDHATGKLEEDDYRALHARLSAEAIEVMRQLDAAEATREAEIAARTVPHPGPRSRGRTR